MSFLLIALLPFPVIAGTLDAETAAAGIIGSWRLLSFEREGQPAKYYKDQARIWTFDGQRFSVSSEDLGGEIHDSYRLLRSIFRIRTTIIILSEKLKNTHLPHGKFVVRAIDEGILTLGDWDGKVTYTLERVSN
jgi:hypothetical protein